MDSHLIKSTCLRNAKKEKKIYLLKWKKKECRHYIFKFTFRHHQKTFPLFYGASGW